MDTTEKRAGSSHKIPTKFSENLNKFIIASKKAWGLSAGGQQVPLEIRSYTIKYNSLANVQIVRLLTIYKTWLESTDAVFVSLYSKRNNPFTSLS